MQHNLLQLLLALLAGALLGTAYFGGLWLTVDRLRRASRPGLLLLASFVARTVLVLSGFYLVMGREWQPLLACVAGFLLTRTIFIRCLRPDASAKLVAKAPN